MGGLFSGVPPSPQSDPIYVFVAYYYVLLYFENCVTCSWSLKPQISQCIGSTFQVLG